MGRSRRSLLPFRNFQHGQKTIRKRDRVQGLRNPRVCGPGGRGCSFSTHVPLFPHKQEKSVQIQLSCSLPTLWGIKNKNKFPHGGEPCLSKLCHMAVMAGGGARRSRWCWMVNVTLDQPLLTTEQPAVARQTSPEVAMKLLGVDFFIMSCHPR